MAGLLTPTSGSITFRGQEVTTLSGRALGEYRRYTVGVVFQAFNLIPSLSARDNVIAPLRLAGVSFRQASHRADELLASVGLTDQARSLPSKMSGGQQQRVAIARALVQNPPLVLADEPTAHLDHIQVEGVLRLIRTIAEPGRMVVVSTHDDRITHIADRVIELVARFTDAHREPQEVELDSGEVIFQQNDRSALVYAIASGEVELYLVRDDGSEEILAVLGAGNYFGELGPMLNLPRSASARARTPVRLIAAPVATFRRRSPREWASQVL